MFNDLNAAKSIYTLSKNEINKNTLTLCLEMLHSFPNSHNTFIHSENSKTLRETLLIILH